MRRARHASKQRHGGASQARRDGGHTNGKDSILADARKQRYREKNKVAAAACRSRQRKQIQTIQEKESRLREENAKLRTIIQDLRSELNALRSVALDHQVCQCRVASYNICQVSRILANYHDS
jgi:hypothetical protein